MVVLLEGSPISTEELWSSVRVTIRFLVTSLNKAILTLLCSDIFWYPSPDLCLYTILSRFSTVNSFDLMAGCWIWHALSTVVPYRDRSVPFQILSNQLNLPQVDSNQVVETSQGWSMETGCTELNFKSHSKGSEFCILFVINLQKCLKTRFHSVLWGVCWDCWGK